MDRERLRYLIAREGNEAAKTWALQTLRMYRTYLLNPKSKHILHRRAMIQSYLNLKRFYFTGVKI
jgi:hypothetical protein